MKNKAIEQVQSSRTVAEQIIWLRYQYALETTPMHAIKLVFLCHGWMLGIHERNLIDEPVEAWQYGPVIPTVYHTYKSFGGEKITSVPKDQTTRFDNKQRTLIQDVIDAYKDYSAWDLSAITHLPKSPWAKVYRNGHGLGAIIPNELIKSYYSQLARSS